jgi:dCTP diphosphatase
MAAMTTSTPATPPSPSPAAADSLADLRELTRRFARERDWEQFHTPKNLAMALSVEVAELVEHFQWLRTGADAELGDAARVGIRHELADVLLYLVQLADKTGVDLHAAALEKMALNAVKYPAGAANDLTSRAPGGSAPTR